MNIVKMALICALLVIVPASHTAAYDLKPLVVELTPSGSGSSGSMTITNTHEVPIAIEISVHKRQQQDDGSDELSPELDDVIINPPQMVMQPGTSQAVRIQWVGDQNPDRELSYRIVTEQLPIRLTKAQRNDRTAELTMKYRYEAALYVAPRGVRPSAKLESAEVVEQNGVSMLAVTIVSDGTSRAILNEPRLVLAGPQGEVVVDGESMAAFQGLNVLSGSKRVVFIPAPAGLPSGSISGSLESDFFTTG